VLEQLAMAAALTSLAACTGGGINAGEKGGTAFILMALMLIALAAILYFILGREE
jgi:hypothetical protein